MNIAVFGDVHGNRFALEAVLEDMAAVRPDAHLNLGDGLFGGADPAGAHELQEGLTQEHSVHAVRGNTDERLFEGAQGETRAWLHRVLPAGAIQRAAALPLSLSLADGAVLAGHGAPGSAWDYLLWDPERERWKGDAAVAAALREVDERVRVVVVGHSHREHLRQLGRHTVVNCGAVSRQKDGCTQARWALIEGEGDRWNVQFRRVPYDVAAAAAWAREHAPGGEAEARQLETGREG